MSARKWPVPLGTGARLGDDDRVWATLIIVERCLGNMMMADQIRDGERIQIVEERAHVAKREVETGRVRVSTVVDVRDEIISASLAREALTVERRAVEREVSVAPPPREEGDATIISIVEERAVVTKTLFVVEELIVRRTTVTDAIEIPVSLRAMRAVVEQDASISNEERH